MKKPSKNDYVLNQVRTPIDENIQLQQIAESANITKKALMENIISSYLHEEKVSELLPNMIDQNRRLSEFSKMEREAAGSSERASFNQIVKYINDELKSLRKQIRGIIREIRNLEKGRDQEPTELPKKPNEQILINFINSLSEKQQEEFSEISGYLRSVNEKLDCSLITALFADWLRRRK